MTLLPPAPRGAGSDRLALLARLTERDLLLCRVLHDHGVLTTCQVRDLAFPSLSAAQHRLLALCRLGVVVRFRRHRPAGSEPYHYAIGEAGAALVAAERGADPPRPSALRARTLALAQSPRLAHLLGVNGFFCALAAEARRLPDAALEAWWPERRCAAEWGEWARPDAFGVWREGGRRAAFLLEHDTGTEPLRRLSDKLAGYADLALAEGGPMPVLFRLPTARRESAARRVLAHPEVAVFTSAADEPGGPAGAVWLACGADGPRLRLAELTARGGGRPERVWGSTR